MIYKKEDFVILYIHEIDLVNDQFVSPVIYFSSKVRSVPGLMDISEYYPFTDESLSVLSMVYPIIGEGIQNFKKLEGLWHSWSDRESADKGLRCSLYSVSHLGVN